MLTLKDDMKQLQWLR